MAYGALPWVYSARVSAHGREELSMTTGLDTTPTSAAADPAARKSRRGTETRQRTKNLMLRLLPQEQEVAAVVASQFDMKSVQALIVDVCQPLMTPGALTALAADRDALQALAREHGISEAQALLLRAFTESAPVAC